MVILSFIDDKRASNNGKRAAELNKSISVLIFSVCIEAALDLLDVTDTTLHDILVGVTTVRAEWIVDITDGLTAVGKVSFLVHLNGVNAWLQSLEDTVEKCVIAMRFL